jgi:hypothetical protein
MNKFIFRYMPKKKVKARVMIFCNNSLDSQLEFKSIFNRCIFKYILIVLEVGNIFYSLVINTTIIKKSLLCTDKNGHFVTNFLTFMLNKLHVTLVAKNKEFWMKEKVNEIHLHPLINHICIVTCN